MTPAVAAYRMACALALGAALGLVYGFLRPLRPRHTLLSDSVFLAVTAWVWMYRASESVPGTSGRAMLSDF